MGVRDLQHDRVDQAAGEAVLRVLRSPAGQVRRGPVGYRGVDEGQQRQVDVEGIGDAPGPQPGAVPAGRLAGPACQHPLSGRGVVTGRPAGQDVQLQGLPPVGVRLAEGHPVGQGLDVGPVEVDLELIAGLVVETRLGVQAVDVGVDVHHEHRAALAGKHVQVVEVQLAGLGGQRRVEIPASPTTIRPLAATTRNQDGRILDTPRHRKGMNHGSYQP
jgi:hypothetical protein